MSNQVGFQFQGDVFAGGQLAFSAAGRLLKALSDGGVDVYAAAAVFELGKKITITQHQEAIVSQSVQKRDISRQGIFAKALRIGWGHNELAYEFSRTRAGCAALLLTSAFAAGTRTYRAAQGLQELMSLNGCEPSHLPSVDVIHRVVRHVIPIMEDSGFHAVYALIKTAAIGCLKREDIGVEFPATISAAEQDITSPRDWADAVQQLILSSTLRESIHIQASGRGLWLTAFAVHTLGAATTLLYGSHTLWAAAGENGSVTIQLDRHQTSPKGSFRTLFTLLIGEEDMRHLEDTYVLKDTLEVELMRLPQVPIERHPWIKRCIVRILSQLVTHFRFKTLGQNGGIRGAPILAASGQRVQLLASVCRSMGLDMEDLESTVSSCLHWAVSVKDFLSWEAERLVDGDAVDDLIQGFAMTALALVPCVYDSASLRVGAGIIIGRRPDWTSSMIEETAAGRCIEMSAIFSHLQCLLGGGSTVNDLRYTYVATAGRSATVAFRALLEEEAFGPQGQFLEIYPGRISYEGCSRDAVCEELGHPRFGNRLTHWNIAPGTKFRPFDLRHGSDLEIACGVTVREHDIAVRHTFKPPSSALVSIRLMGTSEQCNPAEMIFSLTHAIYCWFQTVVAPVCGHPRDLPFLVPREEGRCFETIKAGIAPVDPEPGSCLFISAYGGLWPQLIAMSDAGKVRYSGLDFAAFVRQGNSCLSCAYATAQTLYEESSSKKKAAVVVCHDDVESLLPASDTPVDEHRLLSNAEPHHRSPDGRGQRQITDGTTPLAQQRSSPQS